MLTRVFCRCGARPTASVCPDCGKAAVLYIVGLIGVVLGILALLLLARLIKDIAEPWGGVIWL